MACYVVIKKGDNKVLDVGNLMSYSMHGNTKVAHVYHPVIDCHVQGFCWWNTSEYEVHRIEDLSYWDVLEKYKIEGDREGVDILEYYKKKEKIVKGLKEKYDRIANRNLYTKYKTAPTEEEKEKARQEYLNRKGIHSDFRW